MGWLAIITTLLAILPLLIKLIGGWKKNHKISPRQQKALNRIMANCQTINRQLGDWGCVPDNGTDPIEVVEEKA